VPVSIFVPFFVFVPFEFHCSYNNNDISGKVNDFFIPDGDGRILSAKKPLKSRLLSETFSSFWGRTPAKLFSAASKTKFIRVPV